MRKWNPFRGNRRIASQQAKRNRIFDAGLAGLSKDEMRELGTKAIRSSKVRTMPPGKRRDYEPRS